MYGGDGRSTFGLPDLQGRVPISYGQGPGLTDYIEGEEIGVENVTLLSNENGIHSHSLNATTNQGNTATAANNQMASAQSGSVHTGFTNATMYTTASPNTSFSPFAVSFTGGSLPHNNIQPYQVLSYCIALQGIYPARN
jgi:microcystin-dependent protein